MKRGGGGEGKDSQQWVDPDRETAAVAKGVVAVASRGAQGGPIPMVVRPGIYEADLFAEIIHREMFKSSWIFYGPRIVTPPRSGFTTGAVEFSNSRKIPSLLSDRTLSPIESSRNTSSR